MRLSVFLCPSDPGTAKARHSYRAVTGTGHFDHTYDGVVPNGTFYRGSSVSMSDMTDGTSTTAVFTEHLTGAGSGDRGRMRGSWCLSKWPFTTEDDCLNNMPTSTTQGHTAISSFLGGVVPFDRTPNVRKPGCAAKFSEIDQAVSTTPWEKLDHAWAMAFDGPSSLHSGGVNVLQGDGSVRFVNDTVNKRTWQALATIAGGEAISSDEF